MDPIVADLHPGCVFSLVARIGDSLSGDIVTCQGLWPVQEFTLRCSSALAAGTYTFYDLVKLPQDGFSLIDVCSGIGGFTIGSQPVGFHTGVFVDHNDLACSVLLANFDVPVVHGDISLMWIVKKVHSYRPQGHVQLTAGFPCQPFSRQGDGRGLRDSRGGVLPAILRAAWLLDVQSILLECVANVVNFQEAQDLLDSFAVDTRMSISKLVFDLCFQWPMRRQRFWCLFMDSSLPQVNLYPWPKTSEFGSLGTIMPLDALWDWDDESELVWSDEEKMLFFDMAFGADRRILTPDGVAATVLHSWGNTMSLCEIAPVAADLPSPWIGFELVGCVALGLTPLASMALGISIRKKEHCYARKWITKSMSLPRQLHFETDGAIMTLDVHEPTCAKQVLYAEKHFQGWGQIPLLFADGERVQGDDVLHADQLYQLNYRQPKRLLPCPFPSLTEVGFGMWDGVDELPADLNHLGLGDRFLWQCMTQYLNAPDVEARFFTMYPFRALQFLHMELPSEVVEDWHPKIRAATSGIVLVLIHAQHWVVLAAAETSPATDGLCWTLYDGLREGPQAAEVMVISACVVSKFSRLMDCQVDSFSVDCVFPQTLPYTCGSIALAHMAWLAGSPAFADWDEFSIHHELLSLQEHFQPLIAFGAENSLEALTALLNKKGVPKEHATDRAKQDHKQKKKASTRSSRIPTSLDPTKLVLDANHFQDDDAQPVPQLQFGDVEAEQRGIALCTVQQAYKFLEDPTSISVEALALLLVDHPSEEVIASAGLKKMAVPAFCPGTDERTLIFGYVLQLGDQKVSCTKMAKVTSPEIVKTSVALKLCSGQSCGKDCPRFHPGLDESIDNVLFEVWARSCYNDKGTKCDSGDATSFTVFVRIPDGALAGILAGTPDGVYAEPRGDQPRAHDDRYRVIWLPGDNHSEALHKSRTCNKAVSLVRLRQKYGIRVLRSDEASAWSFLRPGIDYVNSSIAKIYELHPVPHGTQRNTIAKLLKEWGWVARPLQPGRGTVTHMSWRVGSEVAPPQMVLAGIRC
eukprot:Skav228983  [mRNA]  locus=scaffold127:31096:34704:+ [translate_table: standard]